MRSQKKRIYGLFIITLMFSSLISALFSPSITPMGENFADNLYFDQIPNSQTSHTFSFLSINGTEIQEFGTFNIYMNEFIEIIVQNSSSDDIVSVVFTYNHTINPSTSKGIVNLDENAGQFDKIVEFTYLLQSGLYNASITTYNGSSYQDFTFYLNLINPDPMIHAVYVRDITWNNVWTRIYEDQAFQTYRNTALEINVTVGNEDNINSIDTVLLYYEDGIKGTYAEDTMTTNDIPGVFGNYVVKNYTSSDIQTNFDSSTSGRNKWRPQPPGDNYKVGIEASDTENNEWYFNFSIEILNQAPKISIFNINNTSPDGNATINIEINATDLEDDILYEGDQTNSYSYCTTPIAHNWSSSGIETVDINPMVQYLDEDDHTEINKFNFTAQDSYYDVNFTINPEYTNLTHITDFYINFTYWTNISSTIDMRVYRASDTTWVSTIFTNLTGNETLQDISNSTGLLGWDIEDFCRESNDYQIQIRFRHTTDPDLLGGDGELFHLDCINLTYITEIRTSVSSIGIQVLGPFDEFISTRFIDISKMWKRSAENLWSYDYEFNSESHDYGTYTIVVKVFDYGVFTNIDPEKHYHQDIGNQLLFEEQDYGLQYFNDKITSGMRGYAIGSQVIGFNIPDAELIDLENYGVTLGDQSQADCEPNTDLNMQIQVENHLSSSDNYHIYYEQDKPGESVSIQNGSVGYNPSNIDDSWIPSPDDDTNISKNDGRTSLINISYPAQDNQSIIFNNTVSSHYWIEKENINGIKFQVNWSFSANGPGISECIISLYNFTSNTWTNKFWSETSGNNLCEDSGTLAYYTSTWINKTDYDFNDIITVDSYGNYKIMSRVCVIDDNSNLSPLNVTIDYQGLVVGYENHFSTHLHLTDSDGDSFEVNMTDRSQVQNNIIQYQYDFTEIKNKSLDYICWFDFQNGNSSAKFIGGRYRGQGIATTTNINIPQIKYSEEEDPWDINYSCRVRRRIIEQTNNDYFKLNIYRGSNIGDPFMINGTLSQEARISVANYTSGDSLFLVELKSAGTDISPISYSLSDSEIEYFPIDGIWNLTQTLDIADFNPGKYYYRLKLKSHENIYLASNWTELRILNYQPNVTINYAITNNAGDYYREVTDFNYEIDVTEYDNSSNLDVDLVMYSFNRYDSNWEFWKKDLDNNPASSSGNTYTYSGTVVFGREISIDDYTQIFFNITDDEQLSGGKRIEDASIAIKNTAPSIGPGISTNLSISDEIFRNNGVKLSWNITDPDDDWDNTNFELNQLMLTDPDSISINLTVGDNLFNSSSGLYEYEIFFTRENSTGDFSFNIGYQDPDGDDLSNGNNFTITIDVKNNLPILKDLIIENIDTSELVSLSDNNITEFRIYRGQRLNITAIISDIEDTYLNPYTISNINFTIHHNNESEIQDLNYETLNLATAIYNKTENYNETWNVELDMNSTLDFHAGGYTFGVDMMDRDLDTNTVLNSEIGLLNRDPQIVTGTNYENGYNIENELGDINFETISLGDTFKINVFAEDNDPSEHGIQKIIVFYKISEFGFEQTFPGKEYDAGNWVYNPATNKFILELSTDDDSWPAYSESIRIYKIEIQDLDFIHINNNEYGYGRKIIEIDDILIIFTNVPVNPIDGLVFGLSIAGVIGIGVFVFFYYKRHFSYQKYLDDDF